MCEEVKPLSVFLPLASLYEGMELMMACKYFSCSRLVESAWDGPETKHNCFYFLFFFYCICILFHHYILFCLFLCSSASCNCGVVVRELGLNSKVQTEEHSASMPTIKDCLHELLECMN